MPITFDLHTHTHYSDGKPSVEESIESARSQQLILGISDHGSGHPWYGVKKKKWTDEKQEIEHYTRSASSIPVLHGVEANIMNADGSNDLEGLPPFDYVLIGHHKGIFPRSFFSTYLMLLKQLNRDKARSLITEASIACMNDSRVDVITHPGAYVPVDIAALAAAAKEKGVLIELNQRHPLSIQQARKAYLAGATFLLSSDAHRSEHIGQVQRAEAVAKAAEIPAEAIINHPDYHWDRNIRLQRLHPILTRAHA